VLGFVGLRDYVPRLNLYLAGIGQPVFGVGPLDFVYYDLQLFLVSSAPVAYGGPYPWQLEIARFGPEHRRRDPKKLLFEMRGGLADGRRVGGAGTAAAGWDREGKARVADLRGHRA